MMLQYQPLVLKQNWVTRANMLKNGKSIIFLTERVPNLLRLLTTLQKIVFEKKIPAILGVLVARAVNTKLCARTYVHVYLI